MKEPRNSQKGDLARLLRFLGNASGTHRSADRPDRVLVEVGSRSQIFSRALIDLAMTDGLVRSDETGLVATAEARTFLRRWMATREEAFLDQHRQSEQRTLSDDGESLHVTVNLAESPLAQLARLKNKAGTPWFDPDAIRAGERLARDFQFAGLQPKMTMTYAPRLAGRPPAGQRMASPLSDDIVAARIRVNGAVEAMGPDLAGVALDICCFEKGLETVERERQWPARSAKLMLRTALMQLHRHYCPPAKPARRSHTWGGEGYRPDLGNR
ncbi:DUF6456 domain-containing protein [Rhizobium alvei]|uniref:DUF6456 domain-containing protein n=1 Tax=Rhizobium alvei TaxID=1132659 RepID=A0ABT8YGC5_9HYPH|nr:DUF6456 domain-containing protein [Rhizobium alvei]MDO6962719.1 DUF6456 domain-containing protein [Rhizobium alvei]